MSTDEPTLLDPFANSHGLAAEGAECLNAHPGPFGTLSTSAFAARGRPSISCASTKSFSRHRHLAKPKVARYPGADQLAQVSATASRLNLLPPVAQPATDAMRTEAPVLPSVQNKTSDENIPLLPREREDCPSAEDRHGSGGDGSHEHGEGEFYEVGYAQDSPFGAQRGERGN